VQEINRLFPNKKNIVLIGHSTGARTAFEVASNTGPAGVGTYDWGVKDRIAALRRSTIGVPRRSARLPQASTVGHLRPRGAHSVRRMEIPPPLPFHMGFCGTDPPPLETCAYSK
jgi:hypothetical protein